MKLLKDLKSEENTKKHISFLRTRLLKMGFLLSLAFFLIGMFLASLYFESIIVGLEVGIVTFVLLMLLFVWSYFSKYEICELELVEKKGSSITGKAKDIDGKWFDVSEGVLFDMLPLNEPTKFYVSGKCICDFYDKSIYDVENTSAENVSDDGDDGEVSPDIEE